MTTMEELEQWLDRIDSVFKIEDILSENITSDFVKSYYKSHHEYNDVGYNVASEADYVHTPLNFDGRFDTQGCYAQPRFIDALIRQDQQVKDVMELGCGKGFNSKYLAALHPEVSFLGLDLTPEFIHHAQARGRKFPKLRFMLGDFHHLPTPDENYDLAFDVEAVCHAKDVRDVLQEVYRVLRPGGFYVAFESFKQPGFDALDRRLIMAAKLSDITMGVGNGQQIDQFIQAAEETGFTVMKQEDITHAILPSLVKFQLSSSQYFESKGLTNLPALPDHVVKNAIAGVLMPFMVEGKALGYYRIVLKKME